MKKTSKKFNLVTVAKRVLVPSVTGVAVNVVDHLINLDEKTMGYILLGVGAVVPEIIKNDMVETAGDAILAVAGYKLSEEFDLASKIGVKATATTGVPVQYNIGKPWNPAEKINARPAGKKDGPSANVQ